MSNPELMKLAEEYFPPDMAWRCSAQEYPEGKHVDLNIEPRRKAVEMAEKLLKAAWEDGRTWGDDDDPVSFNEWLAEIVRQVENGK